MTSAIVAAFAGRQLTVACYRFGSGRFGLGLQRWTGGLCRQVWIEPTHCPTRTRVDAGGPCRARGLGRRSGKSDRAGQARGSSGDIHSPCRCTRYRSVGVTRRRSPLGHTALRVPTRSSTWNLRVRHGAAPALPVTTELRNHPRDFAFARCAPKLPAELGLE
jgi:hypothetical protein